MNKQEIYKILILLKDYNILLVDKDKLGSVDLSHCLVDDSYIIEKLEALK